MKFRSSEMSGFGKDTGYEAGMQQMLYLGLKWLKERNPPLQIWNVDTYSYQGIIGILHTGPTLKELETIWERDPFLKKGGVTGAMHQFVMGHLHYIHKHGFEKWLGEKGERYEFEIPG